MSQRPPGPGDTASLGTPPSRRLATLRSLVLSYGATAVALTRNLLLVPVYLKFIPLEEYGAWLATGNVLAYLMVADFGLMGVVTQRAAAAYGARDFGALGRKIGTGLGVSVALSLTVTLLAASTAPWVAGLMHLSGDEAIRLGRCFLIVAVANGFNLVALAAGGILKSLQRPVLPGLAELLADLASIALTLTLVIQGFGLYSLALGLALRAAVAVTSNGASCLWVTRRKLGLRLRWAREEATSLWRDSYYQFFTSIAVRLQTHADPFLVGLVLGPQSAAVYALTVRAHETVRLISGQWGSALTPSLAHLFGDGQVARFRQVLQTTLMVHTLQAAVGMGGVLAFNRAFVGLWIGPEMYAGDLVTSLFACFGIVAAWNSAPYDALFAMGRFARMCLVAWVTTLVRIPLILALLHLGLWGAPAAALVAVVIRTVLLQRVITAELELSAAMLRSMAAHAVRIGLPPLLLAAAVLSLGRTADGWIALALGGAGYLALAMLAVGVADRGLFRTLRQEARSTLAVSPRR